MDSIVEIVNWITTIVTVASIVAATTSTPKDNEWLAKFYKFVDLLAINIGKAKL
jgi:hypothetical protein|tara:strand:- start:7599 stop:7760 length:162 start_codon:yes stop_codon:yes gene_type:complete